MGKNSRVEWRTAHGWDHLEYPVNPKKTDSDGSEYVERWTSKEYLMPADASRKGYPKWRCKYCQEYIPSDGYTSVYDWDKNTPCANENCKILFELSGGERETPEES